jgi:AmmeMemoRadiSam system protein B
VAGVLAARAEPVSLVVSSDMSHYLPHDLAKERDSLALKAVLDRDPEGLYAVVRRNNITMCGVLPMVLGLTIANLLGAEAAELAAYATSGDASGDYDRVVGYAGVLVS